MIIRYCQFLFKAEKKSLEFGIKHFRLVLTFAGSSLHNSFQRKNPLHFLNPAINLKTFFVSSQQKSSLLWVFRGYLLDEDMQVTYSILILNGMKKIPLYVCRL